MPHSTLSGIVILLLVLFGCYFNVICESESGNVNDVNNQTANTSCYIPNVSTNATAWKLIWQDSFDSTNLSDTDWAVQHESVFCGGNGIQQVSCNVMHNVHLIDGMLVLMAQFEKYYEYLYTAATVTTKRYFTYGRWEFRLAQPVGKQLRTTVFTRNDNEAYWHEFGQIDVASNTQDAIVYRGTHFANSSSAYQPMDQLITGSVLMTTPTLHDFHLYGLEWDSKGVRFFFDDQYSKTLAFDHASKGMSPQHNIRFQIGVGGRLFSKPMPERFELLNWKCPALIVDYVRFYEKIPIDSTSGLEECEDIATNGSKPIVDDICRRALGHVTTEEEDSPLLSKGNWLPVIIIVLLILFLGLLTYLIIQITKVKRTVKKEVSQFGGHYEDPNEYYENVYETANVYEVDPYAESANIKTNSYMQLQEAAAPVGNDYLEIKDGYYKRKSGGGNGPLVVRVEDPGEYETLAHPQAETVLK